MKIELDDWVDIARSSFADDRFSKWFLVSKAYSLFQNSAAEFNVNSYKAQAAILNGLLTHHLDASDGKFVDLRRIGHLLDHFDKLVRCSECLRKDIVGLELLQRLVKCSFYCRIADFILCASLSQQTFGELKLSVLAMFSYRLALRWAFYKEKDGGGADLEFLSLCAAELLTLLRANLRVDAQLEEEMRNCDKNLIFSFLRCYSSGAQSKHTAQFDMSDTSFLLRDLTAPIAVSDLECLGDLSQLMAKAWPLRRDMRFLRRFAWIFAHCPMISYHHLLGPLLAGLQSCSGVESDYLSCSPESITSADVKIFFVRLSCYLKLASCDVVLPWIFHRGPNVQQQQFWNCVNALLDTRHESESLPALLTITNALEQIRIVDDYLSTWRPSSRDVSHLMETMQILETLAELSKNDDEKQMFYWTAKRCATAAKAAVAGIHFPTVAEEAELGNREKALFPPLNCSFELIDESNVLEKIELFFARELGRQTTRDNESFVIQPEEETNKTEVPETRATQHFDSVQADKDTTELQPSKTAAAAAAAIENDFLSKELEDINSLLTRITLHNRSLVKLFAQGPPD